MASDWNVLDWIKRREIDENILHRIQSRLHVTDDLVQRLGLEKELEGHNGCVNCLEWNDTGSLLASASDDFTVIIWDPFRHKQIHGLRTNHHGNIFSVKFMPKSSDRIVVTGAGDFMIGVHDISQGEEIRSICSCHTGRVKRLTTIPDCPHVFLSASEDGTIRQFDLRTPHTCGAEAPNVLIALEHSSGRLAEAKCLAINPLRPELLAVGANDPFVRLYDRRLIHTISLPKPAADQGTPNKKNETKFDNVPSNSVDYFVAGHLPTMQYGLVRKFKNYASTYVTFGPNGRDLLVNLGGEQIYLFDIYAKRNIQSYDFKMSPYFYDDSPSSSKSACCSTSQGSNGYSNGVVAAKAWLLEPLPTDSTKTKSKLPSNVESLRLKANFAFESQDYVNAVRLYNSAISLYPNSAILYGNRAAALMKRSWEGDMYAALRDCEMTLQLEPTHYKSHFRMIRCLLELTWTTQAQEGLKVFKNKFPVHAKSNACRALEKDIETKISAAATETARAEKEKAERNKMNIWDALSRAALSEQEKNRQAHASDYETRFCGHCNTTTDIKEANFFGEDGQYIVAGSDDGSIYFWERKTTNNVRILKGDDSIVNCLQPHPTYCLLATSGIDPVVRLWSPLPQDGRKEAREVVDKDSAASSNQDRMRLDPYGNALLHYGLPIFNAMTTDHNIDSFDEFELTGGSTTHLTCRTS